MKIGVIGVGAIGATLRGHMTRGGADGILFDLWEEHVDAMKEKGLLIDAAQG